MTFFYKVWLMKWYNSLTRWSSEALLSFITSAQLTLVAINRLGVIGAWYPPPPDDELVDDGDRL